VPQACRPPLAPPPQPHPTPTQPQIYILTQFNSTSLNRHLARTYNMGSGVRFGGDGFVEVLAATQTPTDKEWFQGTAGARGAGRGWGRVRGGAGRGADGR
jgi:hypothetical protein